MAKIRVQYLLPTGNKKDGTTIHDLERTIAICEGLKWLRENQPAQYPDGAVRVYLVTNEGIEGVCDPYYGVKIDGDGNGVTKAIAALFESEAGIPDYVLSGYDMVDTVLAKYKKKTEANKGLKFLARGTLRRIVDE